MSNRWIITFSMLVATLTGCTRVPECNMQECRANTYELDLCIRTAASGTCERTDTMKAGESAFLLFMSRSGSDSNSDNGLGDCPSCNSLLSEEKLFSDLDVLHGSDTVRAGLNLLDSSVIERLVPGEQGGWVLGPNVKLKRGNNRFHYQAEMKLKGKLLLTISDSLRFWVDSSVGY